jgi:hypothetical protein
MPSGLRAAHARSPKRKAPGCGSGGFWFLRAFLRGDGPEALALRPSHNLRAFRRRLWRAPCVPVSLASGWVQGGRNIDAPSPVVK